MCNIKIVMLNEAGLNAFYRLKKNVKETFGKNQ